MGSLTVREIVNDKVFTTGLECVAEPDPSANVEESEA